VLESEELITRLEQMVEEAQRRADEEARYREEEPGAAKQPKRRTSTCERSLRGSRGERPHLRQADHARNQPLLDQGPREHQAFHKIGACPRQGL
jgi:hypothetical protein